MWMAFDFLLCLNEYPNATGDVKHPFCLSDVQFKVDTLEALLLCHDFRCPPATNSHLSCLCKQNMLTHTLIYINFVDHDQKADSSAMIMSLLSTVAITILG